MSPPFKKRKFYEHGSKRNSIERLGVLLSHVVASFLEAPDVLKLAICSKRLCQDLNFCQLQINRIGNIFNTIPGKESTNSHKSVDILSMLSHLKFLDKPRLTRWRISSIEIASSYLTATECVLDILQFKQEFLHLQTLIISPELLPAYSYGAFPSLENLVCKVADKDQNWKCSYGIDVLALLGRSCNFPKLKRLRLGSDRCLASIFLEESPSMLPLFSNPGELIEFSWNIHDKRDYGKCDIVPWVEEIILLEDSLNLESLYLRCVSFSVHEKLVMPKLCWLTLQSVYTLCRLELDLCHNLRELTLIHCPDLKEIRTPASLLALKIGNCQNFNTLPDLTGSRLKKIHIEKPEDFTSLDSLRKAKHLEQVILGKGPLHTSRTFIQTSEESCRRIFLDTIAKRKRKLSWAKGLSHLSSIVLNSVEVFVE